MNLDSPLHFCQKDVLSEKNFSPEQIQQKKADHWLGWWLEASFPHHSSKPMTGRPEHRDEYISD